MKRPRVNVKRVWLGILIACFPASLAFAQIGFRQLTTVYPVAVQRGTEVELDILSNYTLDETIGVFTDPVGPEFTFLETEPKPAPRKGRASKGTPFKFRCKVSADQSSGEHEIRIGTAQAVSSVTQFLVTDFPVVTEVAKANDSRDQAQSVDLPVTVCGRCEKSEDRDFFAFELKAGASVTAEIFAQRITDKIHGMVVRGPRIYLMDPLLTLYDQSDRLVARNDNRFGGDSLLQFKAAEAGTYYLEVRDARFAGDPRYVYGVELSTRPYVMAAFPLAVQSGQDVDARLLGTGMDPAARIRLSGETTLEQRSYRADQPRFGRARMTIGDESTNEFRYLISPFSQSTEPSQPHADAATATLLELPRGMSGTIAEAGESDFYRFVAFKDRHYAFEIYSRRLGLPTDSVIELYDSDGKLLTEADDHAVAKSKDSRLFWKAPADGEYVIAVRDLHGRGGVEFLYYLEAREAAPDFELQGEYYYSMLAPGTRMIWFAQVERFHGFDGPVELQVVGLPQGVKQTPITVPPGMKRVAVVLSADADVAPIATLVKIQGRAQIGEGDQQKEIVRDGYVTCEEQGSGGGQARWPIRTQIVGVVKPLDLVEVTASPLNLVLAAGEKVEIAVRIKRKEGFKEGVTLAMSFDYFTSKFGEQLPPGVTLAAASTERLTGDKLEGKIILQAAETAAAVERLPIAPLARVAITFSITTNYCSNPVYLTVTKGDSKLAVEKSP